MPDLNDLTIKSIEQYARIEVRVGSIESSINSLKTDNEKILAKISETLERLAAVSEKLIQNASDHSILHKRIDDMKVDMVSIYDDVESIQKTCQAANHEAIERRLKVIETQMNMLCSALKPLTFRIKGTPVWLILVGMVIVSFIATIINHGSQFKQLISLLF